MYNTWTVPRWNITTCIDLHYQFQQVYTNQFRTWRVPRWNITLCLNFQFTVLVYSKPVYRTSVHWAKKVPRRNITIRLDWYYQTYSSLSIWVAHKNYFRSACLIHPVYSLRYLGLGWKNLGHIIDTLFLELVGLPNVLALVVHQVNFLGWMDQGYHSW